MLLPAMSFKGGWVHLKGANSMPVSRLSLRNTMVGAGWTASVLLLPNGLRKQTLPCSDPISSNEAFSQSA